MKFGEAFTCAMGLKKDIVLRNAKTDPPILKIMNYKLELLKKLFKKLGKDVGEKDKKSKSIRLTTAISVHDLENKKRIDEILWALNLYNRLLYNYIVDLSGLVFKY